MIKAVLLDDESHCNEALHRILKAHCPQINVVGIFTQVVDFLSFADKEHFDLLFLDIKMPGISGFQVLEKLMMSDFQVIFITAFDQYAIKAFKYAALDYLLKPVSDQDIINSVARLTTISQKKEQLGLLKEMLLNRQNEQLRVAIPSMDSYEFVFLKDIVRCEASRNYCQIWVKDQAMPLTCSKPLKEVEELLENGDFIRVHNSHLVNKMAVKKLLKNDGGSLELYDGSKIPVARLRKEWVFEQLMLQ